MLIEYSRDFGYKSIGIVQVVIDHGRICRCKLLLFGILLFNDLPLCRIAQFLGSICRYSNSDMFRFCDILISN